MRVALSLLIALLPLVAAAQAPPAMKANRDQPIEINADSLEVQQEKQVAIFTGNVDATQGDMKLKADQLKVFYRQGGKAGEPARPQAAAGASPAGAITRIEAVGRVFVSSPTQTAQGDQGVYDVERNTITLTSRVVITQDKNVVRGDRLVMNLTTGQARMDGQSRVKGLFVPNKEGQQ